jgi:hypothetical protein
MNKCPVCDERIVGTNESSVVWRQICGHCWRYDLTYYFGTYFERVGDVSWAWTPKEIAPNTVRRWLHRSAVIEQLRSLLRPSGIRWQTHGF